MSVNPASWLGGTMKAGHGRWRRSALAVGAITALSILAACGGSSGGSSGGTGGGSPSSGSSTGLKAAVLFAGAENNRSFGNAVADGAMAAGTKLASKGVTVTVVPNLNTPDQFQQQGAAFANKGYKLLIFAFGGAPNQMLALAKQFPNVTICGLVTLPGPLPSNVCTFGGDYQYGDFLGGVVAAKVSKTHHVATIEGPAFPTLTAEAEGFVLGARWADPTIKVSQLSISSYTDVAAGAAAANSAIASGADVLFPAVDQATQGILQAATAHPGTYVVPQYFDAHSQAPNAVLTTVLVGISGIVEHLIELGQQKQLKNQNYQFTYGELGIGQLIGLYNIPAASSQSLPALLTKVKAMMATGQLTVPFLGNPGDALKYNLSKLPAMPSS